jgi:glycosyltransferase involved in cell wall biosynthesis
MPPGKADVIVAVEHVNAAAMTCLERVLELSGDALHRLIVVAGMGAETARVQLTNLDPRVLVLGQSDSANDVERCNEGLSLREVDAVLLSSNTIVTEGWLSELSAVAHSEERAACASPISSDLWASASPLSPQLKTVGAIDESTARAALAGLPRWTTAPRLDACCVYLRREMIDAVGVLDASFTTLATAVADWVMRAQALGFLARWANHAFVIRTLRPELANYAKVVIDHSQARLEDRHPHLACQVHTHDRSLDGRLVTHALGLVTTGKLSVGYDLRHLPPENIGTRTYAVNLAKALAELSEVELTLLVRCAVQADGLKGRVVTEDEWRDDVAVIHKPAQVFNPQELGLLFGSSAHVVITYQDLIAYRVPVVFSSDPEYEAYRATSGLSVQAAQKILAYSQIAAQEISSEFGIPLAELIAVPLGVEAELFATREPAAPDVARELKLPRRYFFSLATDYPHKNLQGLLDAYAHFRSRWAGNDAPGLVLAGYSLGSRARLYEDVESDQADNGVKFVGPVSPEALRVLYHRAMALVYPSLYEGFGLPPLEAMAAGTPVVAMPFSSVPEVGGDAVLYAEGLSPTDLAHAMERIATSESLRADLRDRGLKRAQDFRWELVAREVLEVYRSAVLSPSLRSLHMRRMLREAILRWAEPFSGSSFQNGRLEDPLGQAEPLGVKNAWKALNVAVHTRLRRELRRFRPAGEQKSA